MQRAAHPVRDVRQVHQDGGRGAFFDLGVEALALPAPHRLDEVQEVVAALVVGGPGFLFSPSQDWYEL